MSVAGSGTLREPLTESQGAQPGFLGPSEGGQIREAFGPGQGGAQGDGQEVAQGVENVQACGGTPWYGLGVGRSLPIG